MVSLGSDGGQVALLPWAARMRSRGGEVVLALALLIAVLPVMLLIAVLIAPTGPVLFRQRRVGQAGRVFTIIKFRSLPVAPGKAIGPLGRFLRAGGFDELPQLFNVLRGEMALVGPRPYVEAMTIEGVDYGRLCPAYNERLRVRPGMTGLAQICGLRGPIRSVAEARARLALDLAYIAERSVWLDLRILLATPSALFGPPAEQPL